jgi:hypothetical protein
MSSDLLVQVCYNNKYCLDMGNKGLNYSVSFKLQVVPYAEKHGNRPAGHTFDVNEQCVWVWGKQKQRLENAPRSKWAFFDKQCTVSHIEDELCAYVMCLRKSGYTVSTEMLYLEASKISQKFNILVTEFKAGYGWV